MIPTVRQSKIGKIAKALIEPFAGGSIVSLTAAFEKMAEQITIHHNHL